jgi:hypothetical protein
MSLYLSLYRIKIFLKILKLLKLILTIKFKMSEIYLNDQFLIEEKLIKKVLKINKIENNSKVNLNKNFKMIRKSI